MRTAHRFGRARAAGALVLALSLLTMGCGSRLEEDEVRSAAGVGVGESASGALSDGSSLDGGLSDSGTSAAPEVSTDTGSTDAAAAAAPTTPVPGAATPSAAATPAAGGTARPGATAAAPAQTRTGTGGQAAPAAGGPAAAQAGSAAPSGGGAAPAPGSPAPAPGAGAAPAAADKPPVVIGNVGDYSGLIGTLMKGGNVMAQVVARYINERGGLDGHPVQMVVGDAGGDPARALSLVRDMVENKGAIALMGNLWVFSANGPRDYLAEKRIPVIGGDSTTQVWIDNPMYFSSGANFPGMALGAMKGLTDLDHTKQAVIYCAEAEQCGVWRDTARANAQRLGVDIVYEAQVSLAQPDFTAECIQAQRNGATAIHTAIDGPSIARFGRACAQQGYKPQMMGISLAIIDSIRSEPALEGLLAPQGNFPFTSSSTPQEKEYQDIRARYASNVSNSPAVATVWVAGVLLREAIKGAPLPPGKVTNEDLLKGLYTIKDNNLGGLAPPLSFTEGEKKDGFRCIYYIRLTNQQWTAPYGSKTTCL
jgi:branched-chain amino acid transport system substrate-binding protein